MAMPKHGMAIFFLQRPLHELPNGTSSRRTDNTFLSTAQRKNHTVQTLMQKCKAFLQSLNSVNRRRIIKPLSIGNRLISQQALADV